MLIIHNNIKENLDSKLVESFTPFIISVYVRVCTFVTYVSK